jgi:Flp pilus assembly protein TadD
LRRRGLKYIAAPDPELYDLASDPGEERNLAPEHAAEAAAFGGRLAAIEASARPERPAPDDPETRARLASLGYVAARSPQRTRLKGSDAPNLQRMVSLFQRFERANARLQGGGASAAAAELAALVAEDPGNPVFRGKLAAALRETGDLAAAVPLYRQAAEDAPDDAEAWYNLATALQEAGESSQARLAAEQALALDAWRPEAHNVLGVALAAEGRLEPARLKLEQAVALDPRNAHGWSNLGNVLRGLERLDEAEGAYQRAAALAPRYAEPLNGLGALEVERDRPREALAYFERALALAPDDHEIRLNRAIAYDTAGENAAAAAAYRDLLQASAGDPRYGPARQAARQLLEALGRRPEKRHPAKEGR